MKIKMKKIKKVQAKTVANRFLKPKGTYGADVYDDEPVRNYVPENHEQTRRQYLIPLTPIILLFVIGLGNNTHLTLSCIYKPPRNHINTSELDAILNASPKVMLLVILMLTTHVGTQRPNTHGNTLFTTGRAPMP
ncbi:hypothetical protein TNCV_3349091 [Trichonephila clavipes]|nr:hypothetical protein TNCV_3349091 [Trichonephila clavipes]